MRRVLVALLVVGALAAVLVRGDVPCRTFGLQPSCYVALEPGPSEDAAELVDVDGATAYASSGELRLTTVAVDEDLGVGEWARSALSSSVETVPRATLFPPDADRDEVTRQNAALMAESQQAATVAGLETAGFAVDTEPDGAEIAEVVRDDLAGALAAGDVIVAVDGRATSDRQAVRAAVGDREPGRTVELEVRRGDEERRVAATLAAHPEAPDEGFLGVVLRDHLDLPVEVAIDAGVIGGPSAGLMFALAIVDLLDADDLTGGAVVAGTGTLAVDGAVGPVGGVRQKVAGAAEAAAGRRPATAFLLPAANLADVEGMRVARELLVVPVGTLEDALAAVAEVRAGRRPAGALALPARGD